MVIIFIYVFVYTEEPTTIYSKPAEERIRDNVELEKENNERTVANSKSKLQKEYAVKSTRIDEIDNMKGIEFEYFIAELLRSIGFKNVIVTKGSGDFGVDILATNINGENTAIQCKRYKAKVGYDSIQQILAGKTKEKCKKAIVITNSYFTKPAFEAAGEFGIELWNRKRLIEEMQKHEPRFTWGNFLNCHYTKPKGKPSYENRVLVP
ncbi:restriction endonuclease [Bacillus dakarensis]|uniref:restriction endonuclease n=1 Tax=Robertmurraya dakarensis TaxID=1926278 RepID=UPI00098201AF|nr:restriction endonuclease [Bacillus dakarensis]